MRVVVTGGAGFVGSHLVDRLVLEGHDVDVIDDLGLGRLANLAEARSAGPGSVRVHTVDVRAAEIEPLLARRPPDVVVHLVDVAEDAGLAERFDVVARGLANVVEAARRAGATKVVTAVSSDVYGVNDGRVAETAPRVPVSTRGVVDAAVIAFVESMRTAYDLEFTVLVLPGLFGRRDVRSVVARLKAARSGATFTVHGDGTQRRDLLAVSDGTDALVRALTRGGGLVLNIASGLEMSVNDLVGLAGVSVNSGGRRPGHRERVSLDASRAAIYLGWKPFTPVPGAVSELFDE
jgi:UDP-glucose 4-epimerase